MIFTVRTDRWADEVIVPVCDEPFDPEVVTYMSVKEGRCILPRGHRVGRHLCDMPGGARSSWWPMTDEEYKELRLDRGE